MAEYIQETNDKKLLKTTENDRTNSKKLDYSTKLTEETRINQACKLHIPTSRRDVLKKLEKEFVKDVRDTLQVFLKNYFFNFINFKNGSKYFSNSYKK